VINMQDEKISHDKNFWNTIWTDIDEAELDGLMEFCQDFFGDISSVEFDIDNKEIILRATYKTGDGIDQPYNDVPVLEEIVKNYEKIGFAIEYDGAMMYPNGEKEAKWIYGILKIPLTENDNLETIKRKIKEKLNG